MGQIEVYEWLQKEAACGRWCWVSVRQVEDGLRALGFSWGVIKDTRGDMMRLMLSGYLQTRFARDAGEFPGRFRLKRKYLRNKT